MKTIIHIIIKEFLQFKRDPKMFAIILVAPVIQLIFLGYAVNFDVNKVHTAVYDLSRSEKSRELIDHFSSSGYFFIDYYVDSYQDLQNYIDNGKVLFALTIPKDFEKDIQSNRTAKLQALFDASDGNSASISAGYMQNIVTAFSRQIIIDFVNKTGSGKGSFFNLPQAEVRVWYNPELLTRNFMVPGIVGLLLVIITLLLTSLGIVKEKEIGTLEQLIVTPIKPHQLIIGKLVPFVLMGFVVVVIVLIAMSLIFGIIVKGSITFLFFASFIFILSTLGLGMFISTISKTQQQAMMISIFLVMMPMVFLSGFAFPIENMPEFIQWLTYIIPLRYFMTIIRGVILKGNGFDVYIVEMIIMAVMGVSILFLSSLRFKRD